MWARHLGLIVAIACIGVPGVARAQDFFNLSPKPLSRAHAAWDERAGCERCHKLGGGVTSQLCLDCHDHQPLKKLIAAGRGLHAKHKGEACTKCHSEHKGRSARITDWAHVGGRRKFDHDRAGFPLDGRHAKVACTKCHLKKLKSGRTSFLGAKPTCDGCHGNTHAFTNAALKKDCDQCHAVGGKRATKMTAKDLPFDHGKRTGTSLGGLHAKTKCADCHKGGRMGMKRKRTCAGCHKQPHGRSFAKSKCADCHSVRVKFAKSSFSHDDTRFALRGVHVTRRCSKCHKSLRRQPKRTCAGCHGRPHKKRFDSLGCKSCHGAGGGHRRFDHGKHTPFALTGQHTDLGCRDCHRGRKPWKFERLEKGETCRGCHTHAKAHNGEFEDKECTKCHEEGGSKELRFDHDKDARFALTGFHEKLACKKCHAGSKFRTGKLACGDCHKDAHKGTLGADCERCHATDVRFAEIVFDHDRLTDYPLVGLHAKAKCEGCHPKKKYAIGEKRCVDCHRADDPHVSTLGNDCEKCHEPLPGATKFDHAVLTAFRLTGKHEKTDCGYCHEHVEPPRPPQPVGWAAKLQHAPKADMQFPRRGQGVRALPPRYARRRLRHGVRDLPQHGLLRGRRTCGPRHRCVPSDGHARSAGLRTLPPAEGRARRARDLLRHVPPERRHPPETHWARSAVTATRSSTGARRASITRAWASCSRGRTGRRSAATATRAGATSGRRATASRATWATLRPRRPRRTRRR